MEEPLPCPFCGGEIAPYELTDWAGGNSRYYIQCYNNNCEVNPSMNRPSDSEENAVRRWNKRKEN
jgi:hypothetical protein